VSAADAQFWSEHVSSFEQIALASGAALNLTGAGEPERLVAGTVTPNFLRMLGATTQLGRLPLDEEDQPGRDRVIVLTDALWRGRFSADPAIVGRSIALNGVGHEIIGVLGASFKAPNIKLLHSLPTREMMPQMWKPLALPPERRPAIGGYSYASLARLKPGASLAQAREELAAVQKNLVAGVPGKGDLRTVVVPMQEQMASRTQSGLTLLLLTVGTVLVIGCVNIANLLLARTIARRKEMSVRAAIGAGRTRIARQLLVENLVLAVFGGLGGLAVAYGALQVIVAIAPADLPRLDEVMLDVRVLIFTAVVTILCGLLIGLVPAWRSGRLDLHSALKSRGEADAHPGTIRLRSTLVACEIGLSAASVVVAALLLQSFAGLLKAETGFNAEKLLTADVYLAGPRYPGPQQQAAFIDAVVSDIQQTPEVATVAVSTQLPLTGTGSLSALSVEGTTALATERPSADVRSVSPGYFHAMSLPIKTGRLIEATDRERNVAVLSEQLAQRGWPGQDPIGRRFRFGVNPAAIVYEVIGTVGDVRGTALDQPLTPTAYVPYPQRTVGGVTLIVKTTEDPSRLAPLVGRTIRAHDPELPIVAFRTMGDVLNDSLAARRFQLLVVAFFAALAALLASLGVYGVMAYSVAQRSGEIGIRLALGAGPGGVVFGVMRDALTLAAGGLLVAIPITLMSGSFLSKFLVGVTPRDPLVLGATAAIIGVTALLAAAGPGLRASRVDPMVALRSE
jgi:putative ABC transport system permease protein